MPRMRSQVLPSALKNVCSLGTEHGREPSLCGPGVLDCQTCQMRLDSIYGFEEKSLRRASASSTCETQPVLLWSDISVYNNCLGRIWSMQIPRPGLGLSQRFWLYRPDGAWKSAHSVIAQGTLMSLVFWPSSEKTAHQTTTPIRGHISPFSGKVEFAENPRMQISHDRTRCQ